MRFYAKKFVLKESSVRTWKNAYTQVFEPAHTYAVRGRVNQVLWAEQFWNSHPRKLDRKIFEDCPSTKIGPLENFPLYGNKVIERHGLNNQLSQRDFTQRAAALLLFVVVTRIQSSCTNAPFALTGSKGQAYIHDTSTHFDYNNYIAFIGTHTKYASLYMKRHPLLCIGYILPYMVHLV